jgi:hypothetical protein
MFASVIKYIDKNESISLIEIENIIPQYLGNMPMDILID